MLKTLVYRGLIFFLGHLPLSALRVLGVTMGSAAWLLRTRMWLVTKQNIELCYPHLDDRHTTVLSKESLQETGKTILETCFAWSRPTSLVLHQITEVSGQDPIDQARDQGKGIVFVIPHLGNWEIINHYLGNRYGLTHMFQPNKTAALNGYVQTKRSKTGTQFVPADRTGIKAQLAVISSGGCIGMMPDQEPTVHTGQFAPFFGIPALTNELIRGYARRPCKLFVAVCERQGKGFRVQFDEINVGNDNCVLASTNLAIEQAIRRIPAQYLWSYKRFRTRPDGELDFYQENQHPLRAKTEKAFLSAFDQLLKRSSNLIPGMLAPFVTSMMRKRRKITKINLTLTGQDQDLSWTSLQHTAIAALEAPAIWHQKFEQFQNRLKHEPDADLLAGGAMVLTPPHGSREALVRYVANGYRVSEYYHHNPTQSLDEFIQLKRTQLGVRLVGHDEPGRNHLISALERGEVVTLCPDQQPRLRGGLFVDFFGHPGLTTLAIPEILKQTRAPLLLGYAVRSKSDFEIHLLPIEYDPETTLETILNSINQVMEGVIRLNPEQYRWSDKRFNIQPQGVKKVYQ